MKIFTAAGDTSLFGLGSVALIGIPINYILASLAVAYALLRIVMVCVEFYWKWKDRNGSQDRTNGVDGGSARADRRGSGRDDSSV